VDGALELSVGEPRRSFAEQRAEAAEEAERRGGNPGCNKP
jgi:hypothetical protein